MFGTLTKKFSALFSSFAGKRTLTEENISQAMGEVRLALLEADVNYAVAKSFVQNVKDKAIGAGVIQSVTPGQLFIKIVHDELQALMGGKEATLNLDAKPALILLCGLQGSGKTTQCAKLAYYLKKKAQVKKPLLVACDLQRPAAVEQLKLLGTQAGVAVFTLPQANSALDVARAALAHAKAEGHDLVLFDTAGRLHIDEAMMQELEAIYRFVQPQELLFVASAATGQDAVRVAESFHRRVPITGSILTMLDGSAKAGAALSIAQVTGQPLKFEGIGEHLDDLQLFSPHSMADRILGMGDTINLVKRAQEHIDENDKANLEEKMRTASVTYDDYYKQMQVMKKMGSMKSLLSMLPGVGQMLESMPFDEKEFARIEAMIQSMTPKERREECELVPRRRQRIANGSGTSMESVNKLVKSFKQMKQFLKNMPAKKDLQKMLGGALWR